MQQNEDLPTERARALLLSFAISHNATEYCRYITLVALRDFRAQAAIMFRVEPDQTLRRLGQYSETGPLDLDDPGQTNAVKRAIHGNKVIFENQAILDEVDSSTAFLAIPFSRAGAVPGALAIAFKRSPTELDIPAAEIQLLQLTAELIAVNSLPRLRASGMLSKLYFDEPELEEMSAISERQLVILDEMAIGKTNNQIARSLNLSESTIKQESVRIFRILGVKSRQRAVSVGKEMGLI